MPSGADQRYKTTDKTFDEKLIRVKLNEKIEPEEFHQFVRLCLFLQAIFFPNSLYSVKLVIIKSIELLCLWRINE